MKLSVLLTFSCVGVVVVGGGVRSITCPPPCRCDTGSTWRTVDCGDAGLRSVPSNLSSFTSSLNLKNNNLRTVPEGTLKNLRSLRSLRLDANVLSHLSPSSFSGLTCLRHLWLDANVLTSVPVLALRPLSQLQALTLALNRIVSVPERSFSKLTRLLLLHLQHNHITHVGRSSFNGLNQLETLDLSFNRIHVVPEAIRVLIHLRVLNLQNNLVSVVPADAFRGNPSIQTINIQNNRLHCVGHSSLQLRTLDVSSVSHQRPHTLRISGGRCVMSLVLQDVKDSGCVSSHCLDSLHVVFIVSVVFHLLVLVSVWFWSLWRQVPGLGASLRSQVSSSSTLH